MKVVYLDLVFLLNAGMDLLLLFLTGKVWRRKKRGKTMVLAALLGGVWACFVTVNSQSPTGLPAWVTALGTWFLVGPAMVVMSFRPKGIALLKLLMTFYGLTFLVGGGVDAVYYYSHLGAFLQDRLIGGGRMEVPFFLLFLGTVLIAGGCLLLLRLWPFLREPDIRPVRLWFRGKQRELLGLYDTGNRLRDPYFGEPVHILEMAACRELFTEREQKRLTGKAQEAEPCEEETELRILYIPYRSVGREEGVLPAVRMDRLQSGGDLEETWERPWIALVEHPLQKEKRYQMILHPKNNHEE